MRLLILSILLLTLFPSYSQTTVSLGDQKIQSNKLYEIRGNQVVRFTSGIFSDPIFYLDGNRVFSDIYKSKCLYTIVQNKIYRGDSRSSFDLIYELKGDKLLLKTGDIFEKCIYTITDQQIFIGDSNSTFDAVFTLELDVNLPLHKLIVAILIGPA